MIFLRRSDKGGQYFLIAAIIIVVVLFILAGVTNTIITREDKRAYDLAKELNLESVSVINQGIIANPDEINESLEEFVLDYGDYVGEGKEVYFIYGNKTNVIVYFYDPNVISGSIIFDDVIITLNQGEVNPIPVDNIIENTITIKVNDFSYEFNLKEGENFFFILQAIDTKENEETE